MKEEAKVGFDAILNQLHSNIKNIKALLQNISDQLPEFYFFGLLDGLKELEELKADQNLILKINEIAKKIIHGFEGNMFSENINNTIFLALNTSEEIADEK